MRKTILSVAALMLLGGTAGATTIGYSKTNVTRTNAYRLGTATTQGQAIRLPQSKLLLLKGKTIDYCEFAVGTLNIKDKTINVFITTELGGTPIATGTVKMDKTFTKCRWTLDTPYTITGDEKELYVGYTAEMTQSSKLLLGDGNFDIQGCNYALQDGTWVDTYGQNCGSAFITFNVDGDVDYTDITMGRTAFNGYYKAGNDNKFAARFVNTGTTTITEFDALITLDGVEHREHFGELSIAPKTNFSFDLTGVDSETDGEKNVKVEIVNVNGADKESDETDNKIEATVFFYPKNMERGVLIDGFTSQSCTACPAGHATLLSALQACEENLGDKMIEISHHSGYFPDIFTTQEDFDCQFFYNDPSSPSAPAMMANRITDISLASTPVLDTSFGGICSIVTTATQHKPYVSLNLETAIDKTTRQLDVKVGVKPHTALPDGKTVVNVYLVQDGIAAAQVNGGGNFVHNRVSRMTLTGNVWGDELTDLKPNETTTWTKTITLPEKIHSSFWGEDKLQDVVVTGKDGTETTEKRYVYTGKIANLSYAPDEVEISAPLDKLTVVAYVAHCNENSKTDNEVYNCVEAKVGESYRQAGFGDVDGIREVNKGGDKTAADVYVSGGKVCVAGNADAVEVYSLSGAKVDAASRLAKGVYVVNVVSGGKRTTKKVLVD